MSVQTVISDPGLTQDPARDGSVCRLPQLLQHLVLIDGPARTGKTTLARLLSTFERVELERVQEIFDNLGYMSALGKIDRDAAISMMRAAADMDIYNQYLGRNVNCRPGDQTGILKSANPVRYIQRMFAAEGVPTEHKIIAEKPVLLQHVHYQLERIGIFFDAFGDALKVMEMIRHPVDLVAASKSRFRENICESLRGVHLCLRHKDTSVPVFARGWEDEFLRAGPADRVIRIAHEHLTRGRATLGALPQAQQRSVKFVVFERLIGDPNGNAEELAEFLGTTTTTKSAEAVKKVSAIGRTLTGDRDGAYRAIKEECTSENLRRLDEMISIYDEINR